VRITGGGAKSALWRQILADVLNSELITEHTAEGAAYGAAVLAATAVGAFPDVPSACASVIRTTGSTSPGPASADYEAAYPLYRALYPALHPTFSAVAETANQA
jgi:xylulokinase